MLGFPLGLVYANAVEWFLHKHLLHGLGKRKGAMFSFHWHSHHKNARRHAMLDPEYYKPLWNWDSRGKEVASIAALVALHTPLFAVAPWFTAGLWYSGFNYLYKHKRSHTDVEWGKRHMPHHYDHHMGRNQDANWCVTQPWFDWVMGTRVRGEVAAEIAPPAAPRQELPSGIQLRPGADCSAAANDSTVPLSNAGGVRRRGA